MKTSQTIAPDYMGAALADMGDAAKLAHKAGNVDALTSILSAVANLIAGCGAWGGMKQAQMIEAARLCGFESEYYGAGCVRVTLSES